MCVCVCACACVHCAMPVFKLIFAIYRVSISCSSSLDSRCVPILGAYGSSLHIFWIVITKFIVSTFRGTLGCRCEQNVAFEQ